jgi:hypothetical protein
MERSLEKCKPDSSIIRKLFHLIAIVRRQLGQKEPAREVCREGLRRFPDDGGTLALWRTARWPIGIRNSLLLEPLRC